MDVGTANFVGSYSLVSIDGNLPVPAGAVGDCLLSLANGSLLLDPAAADSRPFFLWEVRGAKTCGNIVTDAGVQFRDVGRWSPKTSTALNFESQAGNGFYSGDFVTSTKITVSWNNRILVFGRSN